MTSEHESPVPSISDIRNKTQQFFGVRPCLWQIRVVQEILKGERDVVLIAGTGMGKTLTFWIPLLFRFHRSVQIIVTPLNILGKQNVTTLNKAGLKANFIILFCVPLSLVTVAPFVYKCFVPGLTEWLKELTFRTFKNI